MNYINKYSTAAEYDAAEKDYPNVSLIDGKLTYVAEKPFVPVKFTDTEIEWLFTDGTTEADADNYPTIDAMAAQALVEAVNDPKTYAVTATGWYKYSDGGKINIDLTNAEVWFDGYDGGFQLHIVDGKEDYVLGNAEFSAVTHIIGVTKGTYPSATWGVTYSITEN